MSADGDDKRCWDNQRRILQSLAVIVGIALFVVGFVITVVSLSDASSTSTVRADQLDAAYSGEASSDGAGSVVLGLVLSMAGLVVATTVPAARFIRSSKSRT